MYVNWKVFVSADCGRKRVVLRRDRVVRGSRSESQVLHEVSVTILCSVYTYIIPTYPSTSSDLTYQVVGVRFAAGTLYHGVAGCQLLCRIST